MSNLDLWERRKKTDSKYTKHVKQRGGYTSISPQYQMREATEEFGPYGSGWGLCNTSFKWDLKEQGLVIIDSMFFYVVDGERKEFSISNAWQFMMGAKVDPDFAKKAETNTISKALSRLGFSADVFMGEFDNQEYLFEAQKESAIKHASDKDEERSNQAKQLSEDADRVIAQLSETTVPNAVEGLFKAMARRLRDKDNSKLRELTKAKDEAKTRLGIE